MKTALRFSSALLVVALLFLSGIALAQHETTGNRLGSSQKVSADTTPDDALVIPSDLVLIDVSVLDNKRNFVPGLDKPHFHVFEDQVEQQIEIFSKESVPVSFGFVIDTSGSMRFKLKSVIESAKKLLELCRPGDEV